MKFRLRPLEIEAYQLTKKNRQRPEEWPQWVQDLADNGVIVAGPRASGMVTYLLDDGAFRAPIGLDEWLVEDVHGGLSVWGDTQFEALYEPVKGE